MKKLFFAGALVLSTLTFANTKEEVKEKNNDTKDLLVAYLHLSQDYHLLKQEIEDITKKLSRF